jgi:hypothetical protein
MHRLRNLVRAYRTAVSPMSMTRSKAATVGSAVIYSSLWLSFGVPADPVYIAGRIFGWAVVPAIIVGIWAWRSSKKWSLARFIAIYVLILFVSLTLTIIGLLNNNPSP